MWEPCSKTCIIELQEIWQYGMSLSGLEKQICKISSLMAVGVSLSGSEKHDHI